MIWFRQRVIAPSVRTERSRQSPRACRHLRARILHQAEQPRQRGALFVGGHDRVLVDRDSCPAYELRQSVSVGHLNRFVVPGRFRYPVNSLINKVFGSLVQSLQPKGDFLTLHRKGCQLEPDQSQVRGTDQGRSEPRVGGLERIGISKNSIQTRRKQTVGEDEAPPPTV